MFTRAPATVRTCEFVGKHVPTTDVDKPKDHADRLSVNTNISV